MQHVQHTNRTNRNRSVHWVLGRYMVHITKFIVLFILIFCCGLFNIMLLIVMYCIVGWFLHIYLKIINIPTPKTFILY